MQTNGDVPGVLQDDIRYVRIGQRLLLVGYAIGTEPNVRFGEYLAQRVTRLSVQRVYFIVQCVQMNCKSRRRCICNTGPRLGCEITNGD